MVAASTSIASAAFKWDGLTIALGRIATTR
jgi:hypothetical protein